MQPKKILIGTVPADGHFNPLTSVAVHLKNSGHDVRWYTQDIYKPKLEKLGIPHYPFVKAPQINATNFEHFFSGREKLKSQAAKLRFDLEQLFINRAPEMLEDIDHIHQEFPFDLFIGDILLLCLPMVREKFKVPVIAAGIANVFESSKNLPPAGLGITPEYKWYSTIKHSLLRIIGHQLIFKKPETKYRKMLKEFGVEAPAGALFDIVYRSCDMIWQSGTPGFEYQRSDWNPRLRFVGPLLPYTSNQSKPYSLVRNKKYDNTILVTQGTAEKDLQKLIIPTLEAFKDSNNLVVVTTAFNGTEELRKKYPQENIIIEDFIPFNDIMPLCDVYITNGGYGGVMLGIQNKLPMVVAGVHEGKNEICARVGYFKLGINLKTEKPSPADIRKAVMQITSNPAYSQNIRKLAAEFKQYDTSKLIDKSLEEIFGKQAFVMRKMEQPVKKDIA
jgi:MGT family glycosyltransferase